MRIKGTFDHGRGEGGGDGAGLEGASLAEVSQCELREQAGDDRAQ